MSVRGRIGFGIFTAVYAALIVWLGLLLRRYPLGPTASVLLSLLAAGFFLLMIYAVIGNEAAWARVSVIFGTTLLLCGFAAYFSLKFDLWRRFGNVAAVKELIGRYNGISALVYIAIQFLQVTVIPIPSAVTTLAGVAVFGIWKTVLYSSVGIIAGSMFAFFLGKVFGVKLVVWICGAGAFERYRQIVKGRDGFLLLLMFLLPFFPDDLLCIVAGLSNISYRGFFAMMLLVRPFTVLSVAGAFGGMMHVPFAGWGIAVWLFILLVTVAIFVAGWKYGDAIQNAFLALGEKLRLRMRGKETALAVAPQRAERPHRTVDGEKPLEKPPQRDKNAREKVNYKE